MQRLQLLSFAIRRLCLFGAILACLSCEAEEPRVRKVLFVGIDGVRTDALQAARTPHLDGLRRHGAFAYDTQILGERYRLNDTISAPGWSSILTGVWADKHGVHDSRFEGKNFQQYPDFLARLKRAQPDTKTAVVTSWEPIGRHIVAPADVMQIAQTTEHSLAAYLEADRQVAASARRHVHAGDAGAVFVYFILPDATGHEVGFDPRVRDYRRAIEVVDGLVGTLLRQIRAREFFHNEGWLVLVTTDHGGNGRHHRGGHQDKDVMSVFLIVSGRAARRGRIATPTYIVDPAVTALSYLGVVIDQAWGLDGKVVGLRENN